MSKFCRWHRITVLEKLRDGAIWEIPKCDKVLSSMGKPSRLSMLWADEIALLQAESKGADGGAS